MPLREAGGAQPQGPQPWPETQPAFPQVPCLPGMQLPDPPACLGLSVAWVRAQPRIRCLCGPCGGARPSLSGEPPGGWGRGTPWCVLGLSPTGGLADLLGPQPGPSSPHLLRADPSPQDHVIPSVPWPHSQTLPPTLNSLEATPNCKHTPVGFSPPHFKGKAIPASTSGPSPSRLLPPPGPGPHALTGPSSPTAS